MEIRFLTLESIISDGLMPWLTENNDQQKFKIILKQLHLAECSRPEQFFKQLPVIFGDVHFSLKAILKEEWKLFSTLKTSGHPFFVLNLFRPTTPETPKSAFYSLLIVMSINACSALFDDRMKNTESDSLSLYIVNKTINHCQDILERILKITNTDPDNVKIMTRLFIGLQSFTMRVHEFSAETDDNGLQPLVFCQVQDSVIYRAIAEELKTQIQHLSNDNHQDVKTITQGFENAEQIHVLFKEFRQLIDNIYQISVEKETRKNSDTFVANELLGMGEDIRQLKNTLSMITDRNKQNTINEQDDILLKAAEVQKLLGISKGTLHAMRKKGQISATKIGSQHKYSRDEVHRLLKTRNQKPDK